MIPFSIFDREYFFLNSPDDVCFPFLTPDEDTFYKPYESEALPLGQKPLIFTNGMLELCFEMGQIPVDPPPDVLFSADDLVVREHIAKKLEDMEIPNLVIQPAIYIDHKKKWYEDFWFLTFTERFICWDKKLSKYEHEPSYTDPIRHSIYAYILDAELLEKTPLRERLLFKMGGATLSPVLVHKSIVELFRMRGVDIISVADKAKKSVQFMMDYEEEEE
ncbi:MAG: hypothetical protein LBE22_11755 [Azoarcus sp.]|nr:hypothetical protein [Azoarcus sp.]